MAFNISYKFTVTDGFSSNIRKFKTALKKIGPIMARVARKFADGARRMGSAIDKVRGGMQRVSLGIIAFGLLAGRTIFRFQKGMNMLEAASRATKGEMLKMRKVARDLGRTTEFTAGQAAFAMAELGKAGFTTTQNIEAIPSVLSLASAGSLDLAQAAGIVSSVLKGFVIDTKETVRITDVLALAASSAKTTVAEMGQSMALVAPASVASNVSLEQTAAILATLQDKGIRALRAGTGLKIMMIRLSKFTPDASKALRKMGLSIKEIAGHMKKGDILGIFKKFKKGGLDIAKATDLFGQDAAISALALLDAADAASKLTEELKKAEGTSKRMAETQLQGLPGAIKIAASAFESLQLKIGEVGLTKRFLQMANFIRRLSNTLEEADPKTQNMVVNLGILFVAVTAILIPLGSMAAIVGIIASTFAVAVGPIIAIVAAVVLLTAMLVSLVLEWENVKIAFNARGFFGGLDTVLGSDTEKNLQRQRELTIKLREKLDKKGVKLSKDLINPLAPTKSEVKADVNVKVKVQAEPGTAVTSVESSIDGDVGLNLAGAQ